MASVEHHHQLSPTSLRQGSSKPANSHCFIPAENLALHINRKEKKKNWAAISKSILSCLLKLPATKKIYASFNNGFKKFFDEKLPLGLPLLSMFHPQYMSYQCQFPSYHRCPFSERRVFGTENKGLANSSSHGTFFLAGSIGQPIKKENISVFFCRVIRFWKESFLLLWGPGKSSPIPWLPASDKQKLRTWK